MYRLRSILNKTSDIDEKDIGLALFEARELMRARSYLEALDFLEGVIANVEKCWGLDPKNFQDHPVLSTSSAMRIALAKASATTCSVSSFEVCKAGLADLYSLAALCSSRLGEGYVFRTSNYLAKARQVGFVLPSVYVNEANILLDSNTYDIDDVIQLLNTACMYIADLDDLACVCTSWARVFEIQDRLKLSIDVMHIVCSAYSHTDYSFKGYGLIATLDDYCKKAGVDLNTARRMDSNESLKRVRQAGAAIGVSQVVINYVNSAIEEYKLSYIPFDSDVYEAALMLLRKDELDNMGFDTKYTEVGTLYKHTQLNSDEVIEIITCNIALLLNDYSLGEIDQTDNVGVLVQPLDTWAVPNFKLLAVIDTDKHTVIKNINGIKDIVIPIRDFDGCKFRRIDKKRYLSQLEVIPMFFDCDYDMTVAKITEQNKLFMQLFQDYLESSNVSKKTVDKHMRNVETFLKHYITHCLGKSVLTELFIGPYITWFNDKCLWASPSSVKENIASLNKFYKCLLENGYITKYDYDEMRLEVKEFKDEWIQDSKW